MNSKPLGNYEIDWSHPLTKGLDVYVDSKAYDYVHNILLSKSDTVNTTPDYLQETRGGSAITYGVPLLGIDLLLEPFSKVSYTFHLTIEDIYGTGPHMLYEEGGNSDGLALLYRTSSEGSLTSNRNSDILSAAVDLTTNSEAWVESLGTPIKQEVVITAPVLNNIDNGVVELWVNLVRANTTVWADQLAIKS